MNYASRARAKSRAKNVAPRGAFPHDQEQQLEGLAPVNMKEFYDWLAIRLPAATIKKIKRVNSREGFEQYMKDMEIEFNALVQER